MWICSDERVTDIGGGGDDVAVNFDAVKLSR